MMGSSKILGGTVGNVNAKEINDLILSGVEIEVWRIYAPQFGRDDRIAIELMGSGRIVRQTMDELVLDDGYFYPKAGSKIRIKQK